MTAFSMPTHPCKDNRRKPVRKPLYHAYSVLVRAAISRITGFQVHECPHGDLCTDILVLVVPMFSILEEVHEGKSKFALWLKKGDKEPALALLGFCRMFLQSLLPPYSCFRISAFSAYFVQITITTPSHDRYAEYSKIVRGKIWTE